MSSGGMVEEESTTGGGSVAVGGMPLFASVAGDGALAPAPSPACWSLFPPWDTGLGEALDAVERALPVGAEGSDPAGDAAACSVGGGSAAVGGMPLFASVVGDGAPAPAPAPSPSPACWSLFPPWDTGPGEVLDAVERALPVGAEGSDPAGDTAACSVGAGAGGPVMDTGGPAGSLSKVCLVVSSA
jgi:hypothetical protein